MTDHRMVFFDTETTSLRPDREVWEVGLITANPVGRVLEHEWFVEVKHLDNADPASLDVGRFYARHPWGRWLAGRDAGVQRSPQYNGMFRTRRETAEQLARFLHGATVIGIVPDFDTYGIDPLLREFGLLPKHDYHLIDVNTHAAGYLKGLGVSLGAPPWDTDDVVRALEVAPPSDDEVHTALGDARLVRRIWEAMYGPYGKARA